MGNDIGHKGGQAVPQVKAHQKLDDLAYDTFVGGKEVPDNDGDEEGGSHEERHQYYANLLAKKQSGKMLSPAEHTWFMQANDAHERFKAEKAKPTKFNLDDAALDQYAAPRPGLRKIDNSPGIKGAGDYDPTSDALFGSREGMALQNLEALQKGKAPQGVIDGYNRALTKPQIKVGVGDDYGNVSDFEPNDEDIQIVKDKQGRAVIKAKPGVPIGSDERGNAIDIKGKSLGPQTNGDNMRFLDRKRSDVFSDDTDSFAKTVIGEQPGTELEQQWGAYLDAVEKNGGKYSSDFFKGVSPERKKEIKDGVYQLMLERKNGIKT